MHFSSFLAGCRYNFFASMGAEYSDSELAYFGYPIYGGESAWSDVACLCVFLVAYRMLEYSMLANGVVHGEYNFWEKFKRINCVARVIEWKS